MYRKQDEFDLQLQERGGCDTVLVAKRELNQFPVYRPPDVRWALFFDGGLRIVYIISPNWLTQVNLFPAQRV